jgi:hypothetical protein
MGKLTTSLQSKWATLRFWVANKRLKEGRDYQIDFDEEYLKVKFLNGKFKDVVFTFGGLYVQEDGDCGIIDFHTYVLSNPHDADITGKAFVNATSNILRALLSQTLQDNRVINEIREDDSAESDEERGIREEVSPVLERRLSKRESREEVVSGDSGTHSKVQQAAKRKRGKARTTGKKRPNRK